jgi:hypothetical protein
METAGYLSIGFLFQFLLIKMIQVYTREKRNYKYAFWTFFAGLELFLSSTVIIWGYDEFFYSCHGYGCTGIEIAFVSCWIISALLILLSLIFFLFGYFRTPRESQNESTPDYYGRIRLGLFTVSIILGFIAVTGNTWMVLDFEDDDDNVFVEVGLNEIRISNYDYYYASFDYDEFCGDGPKEKTMTDFLALDYAYPGAPVQIENDAEKYCSLGTVGLLTTTVLWLAIISGAVTIITHLGADYENRIPAMTRFAFSWGTGALMLIGTLVWVITNPYDIGFPPDNVGGSFWLVLLAGLLALSGEIVNTFFAKQDE